MVPLKLFNENTACCSDMASQKYTIVPLHVTHAKEATTVLVDGFAQRNEPFYKGTSPLEFALLMQLMVKITTNNNTSLVAVENNTNKVIGVILYDDELFLEEVVTVCHLAIFVIRIILLSHWDIVFGVAIAWVSMFVLSWFNVLAISIRSSFILLFVAMITVLVAVYFRTSMDPTNKRNVFTRFLNDIAIASELKRDWDKERKDNNENNKGTVLEILLTAVHADYLRRGIGTALKRKMIEMAKQSGYKYIVSEATNEYSQMQNKKIGFKVTKEIYYGEWEYPKKSGKYPYGWVVEETGFQKLSFMVYDLCS
eukprot:239978_1